MSMRARASKPLGPMSFSSKRRSSIAKIGSPGEAAVFPIGLNNRSLDKDPRLSSGGELKISSETTILGSEDFHRTNVSF